MEMESEDGIEGRVRTRRAGRRRIQKRSRNPNLSQLLAGGPYPRSGIKSAPPAAPAPGTIGFGFPGATVGAIPFVFPFAPLGLGLFDADPQRLLTLLQHQSALAEEALRYRNLLFGTVGTAPPVSSSPAPATGSGPEPDCKEGQPQQHHQLPKTTSAVAPNSSSTGTPPSTIRVRDGLTKEGYRNGMGGEELLLLRKLPIPASPEHHAPSSDSVVCDESLLAPFRETPGGGTERDVPPPGTKCHICMAHFPSVWLLEQHSALQHPHLTLHDDKPYQCGLCGQKSRYSCCRYRTVGLTKHHRPGGPGGLAETGVGGTTPTSRSRVPADKLFTCDVCGMQFRYLKSFKKHRLNHALERLHGKKGTVGALAPAPAPAPAAAAAATVADSEPAVSSTNDGQPDGAPMMADAIAADLRGLLRDADALESADDSEQRQAVRDGGDEQDDTVSDSVAPVEQQHTVEVEVEAQPKITSSTSASSSSSSSSSSASSSSASSNSSSSSSSSSNTGGNATSTSITHLPTSTACNGVARALLDDSTPEQLKLHPYHHAQHQQHQQQPAYQRQHHQLHVPGSSSTLSTALDTMEAESSSAQQQQQQQQQHKSHSHTLNSLINAETIPHHRLLGLDPQEASILNFLRVDAAEKQRDRRFACPFCGKCVRSKENLKLHVRKHTGERPFVCLFCGRAFGGKSDLTRHLRIHTGERPYHCEACGKCFARADYLSKHLTTHVHQMSPRP